MAKRRVKSASEQTLRRYLTSLTGAVRHSVVALDRTMKEPESHERGKKIARVLNFLEMENDKARYFGLGIDFRKEKK